MHVWTSGNRVLRRQTAIVPWSERERSAVRKMRLYTPSQSLNPAVSGNLADMSSSGPLLRFAGCVAGSHALVIAPDGLDQLCSLLRQGCIVIEARQPWSRAAAPAKPHPYSRTITAFPSASSSRLSQDGFR